MKKLLLILLISLISSQDVSNEEICLPREQIQALFLDAQKLPLAESKLALKDSIIMSNNEVISWQDSTIVLLKEEIALKDSLFKDLGGENMESTQWYEKYLYALVAFLTGIGTKSIIN